MSDAPDEETLSRTVGDADKVREAFNALPMLAIALEGPQLRATATGVTHLASAGVAALYQLAALSTANGGNPRLYAPPGTTADMIMTLVDLPHESIDPHGA